MFIVKLPMCPMPTTVRIRLISKHVSQLETVKRLSVRDHGLYYSTTLLQIPYQNLNIFFQILLVTMAWLTQQRL